MLKRASIIIVSLLASTLMCNGGYALESQNLNLLTTLSQEAEHEVSFFKEIMKSGSSYALLLSLEEEVPAVAKTISSIALLHELKAVNRNLQQLQKEVKKFNKLFRDDLEHRSFMK